MKMTLYPVFSLDKCISNLFENCKMCSVSQRLGLDSGESPAVGSCMDIILSDNLCHCYTQTVLHVVKHFQFAINHGQ
jgi:hypothetical protein